MKKLFCVLMLMIATNATAARDGFKIGVEGKDVVCFCSPQKCHGDVLVAAVAWARREYDKRNPPFTDGYWNWEENL